MSADQIDRFLLETLLLLTGKVTVENAEKDLLLIRSIIRETLDKYPAKTDFFGNHSPCVAIDDYYSHNDIVGTIRKILSSYFIDCNDFIPYSAFDRRILIGNYINNRINDIFDHIYSINLAFGDIFMINNMKLCINNTLSNGVNIKSTGKGNPYYKRNYPEFLQSLPGSLEYLDRTFAGYISYFGEVPE